MYAGRSCLQSVSAAGQKVHDFFVVVLWGGFFKSCAAFLPVLSAPVASLAAM